MPPRWGPSRSIGSAAAVAFHALAALSLLWAAPSRSTPITESFAAQSSLHASHGHYARIRLERMALSEHDGDSVLTLGFSAPARLRLLRLHQPERIVIDLPHTQRHAELPVRGADSPIAALRAGV